MEVNEEKETPEESKFPRKKTIIDKQSDDEKILEKLKQGGSDELDNDIDRLVDNAPEVSEHAIEAQQEDDKKAEISEKRVDSSGNVFNPDMHAVDALTGEPKLTPTGRFKKISKNKARTSTSENVLKTPNTVINESQPGMPAGTAIVTLYTLAGTMLISDEWAQTPEEMAPQACAWNKYMDQKGVKDVPPIVEALAATGIYALSRLPRPKTKAKLARIKDWFVLKYVKWFGRREVPEVEDN